VSTVSRVMNGYSLVSNKTRNKVLSVISELGYKPGGKGPASSKVSNRTILVITGGAWHSLSDGIAGAARRAGFDAIFLFTNSDNSPSYMRYIENNFVEGIILLNICLDHKTIDALIKKCPVVQCGESQNIPAASLVEYNNEQASYDLTMHLISRGRKKLAFVELESASGYTIKYLRQRTAGFKRALKENGLELNPSLLRSAALKPQSGIEEYLSNENKVVEHILSLDKSSRPDGIVFTSDMLAVGGISTAKRLGISVPVDLSIAAFDDTPFCLITDPKITSLSWPAYEMGRASANLLIQFIEGKAAAPQHVTLGYDIITREST